MTSRYNRQLLLLPIGASSGKYRGFIHHYHLTKGKIDCAGLDLNELFNK